MCSVFDSSTLPVEEKYSKLVPLVQTLGAGKNIFDTISSTAVYVDAAIYAYCPQFIALIP